METLSKRERELVCIGAAIASNCVPCIIYHIGESRKLGIPDEEIQEAVALADRVKKVPAEKVSKAAYSHLELTDEDDNGENAQVCGG